MPLETRMVPVTSFDSASRTFRCDWTTGAQVRQYDWWNDRFYLSDLPLENADLSRLQSKTAPFLNTHNASDISAVLGVIEGATVSGETGSADVRLSQRADVDTIWQDIQDRILCNVSLGAKLNSVAMIPPGVEENIDWIYRAMSWQPMEISVVPINADQDAIIRSAQPVDGTPLYPCEFVVRGAGLPTGAPASQRNQGNDMPRELTPEEIAQAADAEAARAADTVRQVDASRAAGVEAERTRCRELREAVRASTLENREALLEGFISRGVTADAARTEILRLMAERSDAANINPNVRTVTDETETRREAMLDSMLHRVNPGRALTEAGRQYRGLSLLELCRASLDTVGVNTRGMDKRQVAGLALGLENRSGYNTTSDLPFVFGSVINRTMREAYSVAPKTFTSWARPGTLTDFRISSRIQVDGALKFEKINEAGEYKYGSLVDSGETIQLASYGKIVAFTRQMIINDDLSALQRVPLFFGRAAANLESDTVYGILTGNPQMSDGVAVFAAGHKNLAAAGGVIGIDTLSAGRAAMRVQKTPGDNSAMNLTPSVLLVPSALETVAGQYTSNNYTPNVAGQQNPFFGMLKPVVEARLDANSLTAWYLMADNGVIDTVEYCYLDGEEGLFTEQWLDNDVDGIKVKGRLDFAAKAIEYRGMYKNPGAAPA